MINKKIIAIILSIGILISSITPLVINAKNNNELELSFINNLMNSKKNIKSVDKVEEEDMPESVENIGSPKSSTLYEGKRKNKNEESIIDNNEYNLSKEDIEKLIKEGHSIKDILKADEIGNEINEDPKDLLSIKKENKKDLEIIKNEIFDERKKNNIEKLSKKYQTEYEEMINEGLDEEQQLEMLAFIDNISVDSVKEFIKDYKKDGKKVFKEYSKKTKKNVSDDKLSKYNLTTKDVEGLTDEMFNKLEELAEKNNLSVNQLIKGYKKKKDK